MKQVLAAAKGLGNWRTTDIAEHPDVELSERQVREHLTTLAEQGYVDRENKGRGYVWRDDGLREMSTTGEVDLDVVEDDAVVAEVARKSTYTGEFRNSRCQASESVNALPSAGGGDASNVTTDGCRDDPPSE